MWDVGKWDVFGRFVDRLDRFSAKEGQWFIELRKYTWNSKKNLAILFLKIEFWKINCPCWKKKKSLRWSVTWYGTGAKWSILRSFVATQACSLVITHLNQLRPPWLVRSHVKPITITRTTHKLLYVILYLCYSTPMRLSEIWIWFMTC